MAQLWTDIIINPLKSADGQVAMVNEWARRSSSQPLDIGIFLQLQYDDPHEEIILDEFGSVCSVLRSLAVRWKDIALYVPQSFLYVLLNNLGPTPAISSLFLPEAVGGDLIMNPIKLQHPFRPRRFISTNISGMTIPFEWDRLVHFELAVADDSEILHDIRHAGNLTHCIAGQLDNYHDRGRFPIPTTPIISHSLVCLRTKCHIIEHLTLPSLLHLEYDSVLHESVDCFDSVSKFAERSCPPLEDFALLSYVNPELPFPPLAKLPWITLLDINAGGMSPAEADNFANTLSRSFADQILPRLESFAFTTSGLSASSWSSFSRIFPKHTPNDPADFRRPLSQVYVQVNDDDVANAMDKETFLHFSKVRKSGVDLNIADRHTVDVLSCIARVHWVE